MSKGGGVRSQRRTWPVQPPGRALVAALLAVVLAVVPVLHVVVGTPVHGPTADRHLAGEHVYDVASTGADHEHDHEHDHGSSGDETAAQPDSPSFSTRGHGHGHDHGGLEHTHELAAEPSWAAHPSTTVPRMRRATRALARGAYDLSVGLERPPRPA